MFINGSRNKYKLLLMGEVRYGKFRIEKYLQEIFW